MSADVVTCGCCGAEYPEDDPAILPGRHGWACADDDDIELVEEAASA